MEDVRQSVNLELSPRSNEEVHPLSLPIDREVIRPVGNPVDSLRIYRHCFMSVDVGNPSRFLEDFDSLRWRLFDCGSLIRRPGFTYCVSRESIILNMLKIARVVLRALLDGQNSGVRSMLVKVVSVHTVSLPDTGLDEYGEDEEAKIVGDDEEAGIVGDDEEGSIYDDDEEGSIFDDDEEGSIFDDDEEIRMLEESFETAMGFAACPASRKAVASLGRTRVDSGDCSICFEELLLMADHIFMPCGHVFHEVCLLKWLEMTHTSSLSILAPRGGSNNGGGLKALQVSW